MAPSKRLYRIIIKVKRERRDLSASCHFFEVENFDFNDFHALAAHWLAKLPD